MRARPDGTIPQVQHGSVYLRPAEKDDATLFIGWLNDWRTGRTLGVRAPISRAMEEQFIEKLVETQGKEGYHFVICLLADDRPVGTIGLKSLNMIDGNAGIGIFVGADEDRGRGYGSDALRAILRFGFDEIRLERIWLDVFDMNAGAQRVYERVGFVHEGTQRHATFREGVHHDVRRMAILADEWRELAKAEPETGAADADADLEVAGPAAAGLLHAAEGVEAE